MTINHLATLNRLERRACGDYFIPCLKRANDHIQAYSLYLINDKKKGVLFLSSKKTRKERIELMHLLCSMAYCRFNLSEIIGVATENLSSQGRSYDFGYMKKVEFQNRDQLIEGAKKSFGNLRKINHSEYYGDKVIKSARGGGKNKIGRNEPCPCGNNKKYKKCCLL